MDQPYYSDDAVTIYPEGTAVVSADGRFRYLLTRAWTNPAEPGLFDGPGEIRRMLFVMVNPSTADGDVDDPTIRRCKGYAKCEGFNRLEVVNLFAYRATNPDDLLKVDDPVGVENEMYVRHAIEDADMVVCAWGAAYARLHARLFRVEQRLPIEMMVRSTGKTPYCLGFTKGGDPRHPLMTKLDALLVEL